MGLLPVFLGLITLGGLFFLSFAKPGPDCSQSKSHVHCPINPCFLAFCPKGTKCVPNYCSCRHECRPVPIGCFHGGIYYPVGASFPDTHSCNTCTCGSGNIVGCTKIYCPRCWYNGRRYKPGDRFKSIDGCNKCICSSTGSVACTERACPIIKGA